MKVWLDGKLVDAAAAKVSVFDHGLLYGDGVFEGIRAYDGLVFLLDEHLDRLYRGAERIELKVPVSKKALGDAICATLTANGLRDAYIRPVVTRGVGDLGLNPQNCPTPTVFVIADRLTLYPEKFYLEGMDVITCATRRVSPQAIPPEVKSLNYLSNILARIEVNAQGAGEGILLTEEGYIAEGTADNLFLVRKNRLETPPVCLGALPGITRALVMELGRAADIEVVESRLKPDDLAHAQECFLTGTGAEIVPVKSFDGHRIGDGKPGSVTRRLLEAFRAETKKRGRRIS